MDDRKNEQGIDKEWLRRMDLNGKYYHSDHDRKDSYGQTVRTIGQIVHDFSIDCHICDQRAVAEIWGSREESPDIIYVSSLDQNTPDLNRAANLFRFKQYRARVQIQRPGAVVTAHHDDFSQFDTPNEKIIRLLIPLADWQAGQSMTFGNTTLTQWKTGDIIYSDYERIPHSTSNASLNSRPILVITGTVSDYTVNLLAFNMGFVDIDGNTIKFPTII